ncbi:MAG: aromatic-ring-hydroxylating dioxygenase subunit beta [Actinomycetota bacterium]|nr:aromatic-ring-hydroxylating dioxygenase subunit beta [Actinomycetota bacterium]
MSDTVRPTVNDLVSSYVDDTFYDVLRRDIAEWAAAGAPPRGDQAHEIATLLLHEAWLADQQDYEGWLDLYTDDCLYWVPIGPGLPDPQRHVTIACDDRRRLLDRVGWLRTDLAYAQIPPSRTAHQLTGSVVVPSADPDELKVRSSLVVHEQRTGDTRSLGGWCGHVLVRHGDALRIRRKVVSLVDSEHAQHNLTFLL